MTTFIELQDIVAAEDLGDPDNKAFTAPMVSRFINDALVEVGRFAPQLFQEDIQPDNVTLSYMLRADEFPNGVPEVELTRVELWDQSTTPPSYLFSLRPHTRGYVNASAVGWKVWAGKLELPDGFVRLIDAEQHLLRVWGYSPYPTMALEDDVFPGSAEVEAAVREYCRVKALRKLVFDRDLFTQWQTRANNTDVSPAALMSGLSQAEDEWRRRKRELVVLREAP